MNSGERVLTALNRTGRPDKTPFEISWGAFTPVLMKAYRERTGSELHPEEYFSFDTRSVLSTLTRLNSDFNRFSRMSRMKRMLALMNGELYQTIFETAWLMRGMQSFFIDLCLNEELAHAICENITQIRIKQARLLAKAGVDILRLGDDIVNQQGLMMSHETYNTFFKSRIRRIINAAKEVNPDILIFMHCCGKVEEV